MPNPKLLVILSSQDILPATGNPTGWYLPEFAHPYYKLAERVDITVASPKGGAAPVDPYSIESTKDDDMSQRFHSEKKALFENTLPISSFIGKSGEFDAIFYVGGHGRELDSVVFFLVQPLLIQTPAAMFDLANDTTSHELVREFYENEKIVSAVCHGPAALANVRLSDGTYLVSGNIVTGLSNEEEEILQFTKVMPFLLEDRLRQHGGQYKKAAAPFTGNVVESGKGDRLITGQNPPSAGLVGEVLLRRLTT